MTYELQKKPSALEREHSEHPAVQKIEFLNFFLFLWVNFALLDPDPLIESGSNPDPKHWILALSGILISRFKSYFPLVSGPFLK